MKTAIKYQTLDGIWHDSQKDAQRHLEALHGMQLSKLAHDLCQIDKYAATGDYIDDNLNKFLMLARIKEDMKLESNPDEE